MRSIRRTLIAIILGVSTASIVVGFAVWIAFDIREMSRELREKSILNANLTARYCVAPLAFEYPAEAEEVLRGLQTLPEALNACILTPSGEVFATYDRSEDVVTPCPEAGGETTYRDGYLHVFRPIERQGEVYGTLYLRVSTRKLADKISHEIVVVIGLVLALVGLAFVVAHRLQNLISRPLLELADVAGEIARSGDYSLRAATERRDEIGALYHRFNQLCEQVEIREGERDLVEAELHQYQQHLEDLVRARTAELEKVSEELRQALVDAEAGSRAKSDFLANMSHEIRTPLGAILGFAQLLQRDQELTPEQRQRIDTIDRSGRHLLALINEILEMSKIEAGRLTLTTGTYDLHQLMADLETMFAVRTTAKGLSLDVSVDPVVPRAVIGDEGKMRQILINLIGNAVKFTDEGGIAVRVSTLDRDGREQLSIEVEDSGIGIAEEDLPRVFDHFSQSTVGVYAKGGTGLGLTISRHYARIMDGDIVAVSQVGQGSVFTLLVPLQTGEEEALAPVVSERRVVGLGPAQGTWRVLVVDDREDNRLLLTELFSEIGFEVDEAIDGQEAIAVFTRWRPQIVLMDLSMPVMDGRTATERIRALPGGSEPIIVAVTASAFEEELKHLQSRGFDGTVRKPFRTAELLDLIQRLTAISFTYADEGEEIIPAASRVEATPTELRRRAGSLPDELVHKIREAASHGYVERLVGHLDEARGHDESLARGLRALAEDFEYDRILAILSEDRT